MSAWRELKPNHGSPSVRLIRIICVHLCSSVVSFHLDTVRPQHWVLAAVVALGVSCVMTQLALMRELMGAFSGNEMVLGVVLGLWLLLMGFGAWLGRTSEKLHSPLAALSLALMLVAVLPVAQVFLLRALRNVVFIRGAAVGVTGTVGAVLFYCSLTAWWRATP
jgi:hypothetical protein